jgi:nitronate monooxygenase
MRAQAQGVGDVQRMQAWSGQAGRLAKAEPAGLVMQHIWEEARAPLA